MSGFIKSALSLREELRNGMKREAAALRARLGQGELIPVADIKSWRRGWIDRAVAIRRIAKEALAGGVEDESDTIKDLAEAFESSVRETESELIDVARELESSQERGGILTPQERAQRAKREGEHVRGLSCPMCGSALPEPEAVRCAYCDHVLKEGAATSTGWGVGGLDGPDASAAEAARRSTIDRMNALDRTYRAQLENERQGLLLVLRAGHRRTIEFENAMDDASVRLERIWQKLRAVGGQSDDTSDMADHLLDKLLALKTTVFDALQKEARLAWNRAQADADNIVNCAQCGAVLEITNPWVAGEAVCAHCGSITRYSPHLSEFDIGIKRQMDAQTQAQRPAEEEFEHWKQICIDDPSPANVSNFKSAARAMYDKQLFYMKDPEKRRVAVDRYVAQALRDARLKGSE